MVWLMKSTWGWLRWSHQMREGRMTDAGAVEDDQAVHLAGESDASDVAAG